MAKNPSPAPSRSSSPSTSPSSSLGAGGPSTPTANQATATDSIEATVTKGPETPPPAGAQSPVTPPAQSPVTPPPAGQPHTNLGQPVTVVQSPEHAVTVLKEKVHILHSIANNVANYKTLAFNDVEQLMSDIKYLATYIRSKV